MKDDSNPNRLSRAQVTKMRAIKQRDALVRKVIQNFIFYAIFIWAQFIVAYSMTNSDSYKYLVRLNQEFLVRDMRFAFVKNKYSFIKYNYTQIILNCNIAF
jgi:hypothetical protein